MSRRVTCVMVNEDGEHDLIATLSKGGAPNAELNYKITQGALVGTMPFPIPKGGGRGTFVLDGPTVGPSGWACYEVANDIVFQIGFGDPALGAASFTIGFNYLTKNLEGVGEVKFAGPSGPIDAAKVPETTDLTVEYHCSTKARPSTPADAQANGGSNQNVGAQPGGSSSVVLVPYIAKWNQQKQDTQPAITERRMKVLAAIEKTYPLLYESTSVPAKAVPKENGGGTYTHIGPWTAGGTSCTSTCPMVADKVAPAIKNNWNFQAYKQKPGWIQWGDASKKMPSVGDVYILFKDEYKRPIDAGAKPSVPRPRVFDAKKKDPPDTPLSADELSAKKQWAAYDGKVAMHDPHQRHVGIIIEVGADYVMTADGGQTSHGVQAAHLAKRSLKKRKPGPSDASFYDKWKKLMGAKDFWWAKPLDFDADAIYLVGGAEAAGSDPGVRMVGWMDIDLIPDSQWKPIFTDDTWKTAYEAIGKRIESMR